MNYDIAIIGGSLGGVQAAISAASMGKKVFMSEESGWIGGQLTSQAEMCIRDRSCGHQCHSRFCTRFLKP